ncbi:transposase, partial [Stenotrophomonas lactitubi]
MAVKDLCRRHGFSEASYYLWRSKFGGMSVSDAKRLKAELRRVTEERDILKKAAVSSTRQCNMINSCTDRSERYGKDGAARHVSSPEARSMATME